MEEQIQISSYWAHGPTFGEPSLFSGLWHDVLAAIYKFRLRLSGWHVDTVPFPTEGFLSPWMTIRLTGGGTRHARYNHEHERWVDEFGNQYSQYDYPWRPTRTIRVNYAGDIQGAIDRAESGDVVECAPGLYKFTDAIVVPDGVTIAHRRSQD